VVFQAIRLHRFLGWRGGKEKGSRDHHLNVSCQSSIFLRSRGRRRHSDRASGRDTWVGGMISGASPGVDVGRYTSSRSEWTGVGGRNEDCASE
jgi:hypothetical protein